MTVKTIGEASDWQPDHDRLRRGPSFSSTGHSGVEIATPLDYTRLLVIDECSQRRHQAPTVPAKLLFGGNLVQVHLGH